MTQNTALAEFVRLSDVLHRASLTLNASVVKVSTNISSYPGSRKGQKKRAMPNGIINEQRKRVEELFHRGRIIL